MTFRGTSQFAKIGGAISRTGANPPGAAQYFLGSLVSARLRLSARSYRSALPLCWRDHLEMVEAPTPASSPLQATDLGLEGGHVDLEQCRFIARTGLAPVPAGKARKSSAASIE
jgi:hypothetical protein